MADADTIERLRQFLRELAPSARSLLIGELERSLLRSEDVADADLAGAASGVAGTAPGRA